MTDKPEKPGEPDEQSAEGAPPPSLSVHDLKQCAGFYAEIAEELKPVSDACEEARKKARNVQFGTFNRRLIDIRGLITQPAKNRGDDWRTLFDMKTERAGTIFLDLIKKDSIGPWRELAMGTNAADGKSMDGGKQFWEERAIVWIYREGKLFFEDSTLSRERIQNHIAACRAMARIILEEVRRRNHSKNKPPAIAARTPIP